MPLHLRGCWEGFRLYRYHHSLFRVKSFQGLGIQCFRLVETFSQGNLQHGKVLSVTRQMNLLEPWAVDVVIHIFLRVLSLGLEFVG